MSLLLLLRASAVPKLATLVEAFSTTPGNWTAANGASVSGGNAVLPCTSTYCDLIATGPYDFTASYTQIKVAELPQIGNVSTEAQFFVWNDWTDYVLIEKIGANLLCRVRVSNVDTDNYLTYDATNHKYWRIDESSGNVLFKTSPDGSTWTTQFTVAHTFTSGKLLNTTVRLACGYFATESSPGNFLVSSVGPVAESQGPVAGSLGGLTASFAGTAKGNAALAGTLGGITAAFAGTGKGNGALAGTLGGVTAAFAGTGKGNAALAGTLGGVTASFTGVGELILTNNAEGGTLGATVATTDTGSGNPWDGVVIGTGAAVTYTETPLLKGAKSIKYEVGATSASAFTRWDVPLSNIGAAGMWFTYESTFGASCSIMSLNNGGSAYARVQVTSANKIRVISAAGTTLYTSTVTLVPGQRYFVSARFLGAVSGTYEVKIYDASGTILESVGPTAGDFTGQLNRAQFGSVANQTNTNWRTLVADGFAYSNVNMPVPDTSDPGAITGNLGSVTATFAGTGKSDAALTGTLGGLTASFAGTGKSTGVVAGTLGLVTGAFAATAAQPGALAGSLGSVTAAFTANASVTGALAGTLAGLQRRLLTEDFSAYPVGSWVEGETHGNWFPAWSNMLATIVDVSGNKVLEVESTHVGSEGSGVTYSALVLSNKEYDNWTRLSAEVMTTAQWRTPTPEDWETGWLFWNFEHVNHFYYFILKPGAGWEFGKEWHDGTIQRQDFLAYSFAEDYPNNHNFKVTVDQEVNGTDVITSITVEDLTAATAPVLLVDRFVDDGSRESGPAYPAGRIGLYVEDSTAQFDNITLDDRPMLLAQAEADATLTGTLGGLTASFAGASTAGTNTGTLAGTLGGLTAIFAGTGKDDAVLAGTLSSITGSFAGTGKANAALAGTLGGVTASFAGTGKGNATLAGTLGSVTASFAGTGSTSAALNGTLGSVTTSFAGTVANTGTLTGTFSNLIASETGAGEAEGPVVGNLSSVTASFTGSAQDSGTLNGTLGNVTAFFDTDNDNSGIISVTLPALTASLAGDVSQDGALAGTLGQVTADLSGSAAASGAVDGSLGPITGAFSGGTANASTLVITLGSLEASMAGSSRDSGTLSATLPGLTASMQMTLPDLADHSDLMPFFASRYGFASY